MPGVIATSTAGQTGGIGSLFIRGTTTAYSQVVVDGIRLSDTTAPLGNFLAGARLDDLGRIEVLRGPHSAIHGGEVGRRRAVAGDRLRRGRTLDARLRLEAGSFGSLAGQPRPTASSGTLSWFAGLGYESTGNDAELERYDQSRGALRGRMAAERMPDPRRDLPRHRLALSTTRLRSEPDHLDAALGTVYAEREFAPGWTARFTAGHYRESYDNENFGAFGPQPTAPTSTAAASHRPLDRASSTHHTPPVGRVLRAHRLHEQHRHRPGRDRFGGYAGLEWTAGRRAHDERRSSAGKTTRPTATS